MCHCILILTLLPDSLLIFVECWMNSIWRSTKRKKITKSNYCNWRLLADFTSLEFYWFLKLRFIKILLIFAFDSKNWFLKTASSPLLSHQAGEFYLFTVSKFVLHKAVCNGYLTVTCHTKTWNYSVFFLITHYFFQPCPVFLGICPLALFTSPFLLKVEKDIYLKLKFKRFLKKKIK